jgi:hypothetical protein
LERRDTPAPFTPGNLVVARVGDGSGGLVNTGNPVFLDEYTLTGSLVQTIALPSSGTGPYLVSAGNTPTEGFITLSPNKQFLTLAGYNQSLPNATALNTSTSAAINRNIAVFDSTGTPTYTLLDNYASGGNPRSAITSDGTRLWAVSNNGGVVTTTVGSTAVTTVSNTFTNLRTINIFDSQLYVGAQTGSLRVGTVGTGTPIATGQVTANLPGIAGGSPYGFFLADLNPMIPGVDTLYVANDAAPGLEKFSFDGVQWNSNGAIAASSLRGLTGRVAGNCVYLYATNATGSVSQVFSMVDMSGHGGAFSGTLTPIVTAGTLQAFRGITFTPSATTPAEATNIDTPATTVTNSVTYTITFNQAVTGLSASNFALATTGGVTGTIGAPTTVDGITWNVPVTSILGDGTLRLDLVNGTGVNPTLYFLPFVCGKTVAVDNTPLTATLTVVDGIATYYGTPGFNNNVTFSFAGGNFFLSDAENITLGVGTGMFTGGGTPTVSASGISLTAIRINLGAGSDNFTLFNLDRPLTVTGGTDPGDTANFSNTISVSGEVSATGFDFIQQAPGVILGATSLDFQANNIGQFIQPMMSQAETVRALGGAGGVYWQEMNGADFTLRATSFGELNVANQTGTLRIVGASLFADGAVNLSSGDGIEVNAPLGDGTSTGTIVIQANTDGKGSEGYSQSAAGRLFTKAVGTAITINVNLFGGSGSAVLGAGAATGLNANITVNANEGNILWTPGLPPPALNASNPNTLAAFSFNFNTSGASSAVGSALFPLQLNATQEGLTLAKAGTGGVYITDWGAGESNFSAEAAGSGDVQIWTGNGTNNGIIVVAPGINTGTGTISLRSDDNLFVNGPIGGPGFAGPVFLEANLDGANSQGIRMSTPANSITTSNNSAKAVVMNTYSQADTFAGGSVGGVVLSNITVGSGGTVTINTAGTLGNATDANRAGAITALTNTNFINTGNGTVNLTAKNNGIGTDAPGMSMPTTSALRLNITAATITAVANSVASSPAGGNQYDGSIYIHATDAASFSAKTTTAGSMVGRIELSADGPLRLHGDLMTDDGSILLATPASILQDGGTIATTGTLNLVYNLAAVITSPGNSVGTLNLPTRQNLVVNGVLNNANPLNIVGGTLSGVGKVGAVNILDDGPGFDGVLSPGNSPGIFASGNISWSGGSRFKAEMSGPNPGTGYDQLQVTGTVDIGNATLDISDPTFSYTPAPGAKHYIILNDGSDPVVNTFKSFPEGATVVINSIPYTISYVGNGDGGSVGNDVVLIAPGTPMNPPTVSGSITINGGKQRSMVQSLVINFSEPVTINPGAFKVTGYDLGPIGDVGLNINHVGASVTITFNNSGVPIDPASSLKDGKYRLTIVADQVSGPGGTLDGNGNMISEGSPTDNVVFEFHRLFGDGNGDGQVTAIDFSEFRLFYGNTTPGTIFDFDGVGGVTATDFNEFRLRYGLTGYQP